MQQRRSGTRPLALVTGVGRRRGIGAALAIELARGGWDLAISWWSPFDERAHGAADPEGIDAVVHEAEAAGATVARLPVDLADPEQAAALVDRAASGAGVPVTALVLSHCEQQDLDYTTTTLEQWDQHFAVNARAPFLLVQAYARALRAADADTDAGSDAAGAPRDLRRIVALTSDHVAGNLPYGASKGALDRLVLGAAQELADLGVAANVVNPGPNDTGWMTPEIEEAAIAQTPLGRASTPQDTADLVGFLCSPKGGWITGQLLNSDGGFSTR